ncbi:MAG: RIP metalloprotease RseP [Candidatus Magasanikbacteria bacterium]|jgi:regulator of sigma E protease|nr:RIP metalloprotease RseP [Candidatus Magasanikbacteria bacterium]
MTTVLLFILILGLLVFVHEFGHFIAARLSGMKVHEFALGFPPLAIGVYKDPVTKKLVWVSPRKAKRNAIEAGVSAAGEEYPATLYSLNLLPLGGFCRIKGENGEEAAQKDSFGHKSTWKKSIVLVAGVTMNFVLAAVLLGIGFSVGLPTDVTNGIPEDATVVSPPVTMVQQVLTDSPAEKAGIKGADSIIAVSGQHVINASHAQALIEKSEGDMVSVTLQRSGEEVTVDVVPEVLTEGKGYKLGVALADGAVLKYPWYLALVKGMQAAWSSLLAIFISLYILVKGLILGQGAAFEVSGPVGIASIIGESVKLGVVYLINVTAMISLSLAALNILPIPALDGGRLVFVWIEGITGKKVPMKYEQKAHTVGFVLLLILIVVVTFRDIAKLF